jgi:hypothetical protein
MFLNLQLAKQRNIQKHKKEIQKINDMGFSPSFYKTQNIFDMEMEKN